MGVQAESDRDPVNSKHVQCGVANLASCTQAEQSRRCVKPSLELPSAPCTLPASHLRRLLGDRQHVDELGVVQQVALAIGQAEQQVVLREERETTRSG